jgi:hypothetical protein
MTIALVAHSRSQRSAQNVLWRSVIARVVALGCAGCAGNQTIAFTSSEPERFTHDHFRDHAFQASAHCGRLLSEVLRPLRVHG